MKNRRPGGSNIEISEIRRGSTTRDARNREARDHARVDFCSPRPIVTPSLVGATGIEQPGPNPGAVDFEPGAEVPEDIHSVGRRYPVPH